MRNHRLQQARDESWRIEVGRGGCFLCLDLGVVLLLDLNVLINLVLEGFGDEGRHNLSHDEEIKTLGILTFHFQLKYNLIMFYFK